PLEALSSEAQLGVIDNFIQREGTDYGISEVPYETKIAQIRAQIQNGKVKIVYEPTTDTVTLLTKHEWDKLRAERAPSSQG
ncbi:MAG: YheU family protein, partial [Bdellovibrionia bacterium]